MQFELTSDQRMLQDLVDRLAREEHSFAMRCEAMASPTGQIRAFWLRLAELGILGAPLSTAVGGSGGGGVETMLIMQSFGRNLVVAPFVSTILCAATLLSELGSKAQIEEHLPRILAGERLVAFYDAGGWRDIGPESENLSAAACGDGYRLDGTLHVVMGAQWCDQIMVAVRAGSEDSGIFMVPADAAGVTARHFLTIDGGRASEIELDQVIVPRSACLGTGPKIWQPLAKAIDSAAAATCAEVSGCVEAILNSTIDYATTRRQFGRPIGSNQAIAHRIVDMVLANERLSAASHLAALSLALPPPLRQRGVSAAKATAGRAGRWAAQAAVQIHGGIGTTNELPLTHHFRRIEIADLMFGSVDDHRDRYGGLLDDWPLASRKSKADYWPGRVATLPA